MIKINYHISSGKEEINIWSHKVSSSETYERPYEWRLMSASSNYYTYEIICEGSDVEYWVNEVRRIVKHKLENEKYAIQKSIDTLNKPLIMIYDNRKEQ